MDRISHYSSKIFLQVQNHDVVSQKNCNFANVRNAAWLAFAGMQVKSVQNFAVVQKITINSKNVFV